MNKSLRWFFALTTVVLVVVPMPAAEALARGIPTPAPVEPAVSSVAASVVQIFSSLRPPDLYQPWLRTPSQESSGTGVIIEGHHILTNAHVVSYATQVLVQGNDSSDKKLAHVVLFAPDVDLAVLALDDDAFFDLRPPLPRLNRLPTLQSAVETYGYPVGGTSLSITRGIVSRIEYSDLSEATKGLRIQIDAAINPGNSGGPAVVNGQMIGLVFSRSNENTQNIGYLIPNEEIEMFLRQLPGGFYTPKAMLGVNVQDMENPALRDLLKIPATVHGARVSRLRNPAPGNALRLDDVITHINGVPLDDTGMLRFDDGPRLFFAALVQRFGVKGQVPVTIFRGGHSLDLEVPLSVPAPQLIPRLNGAMPEYFVYGPFVFTAATYDYWRDTERASVPWMLAISASPLITRRTEKQAFSGEQVVCLAGALLQHPVARNLNGLSGSVIDTVNGVRVKNLRHLVELLRDSRDEFIALTYAGELATSREVVKRVEAEQATEQILNEISIRQQASPELLKVWQAGRKQSP